MSGVLGTVGLAALNAVSDNINNWLQGGRNVKNSKRLMDYQSQKQVETQSKLNALLYPQTIASMRMAGMNPAMIQGPLSGPTAASPSATQNMEPARSDVIGAANAASNLNLNESQRELNEAQADKLRSEAEVNREEAGIKSKENKYFDANWLANLNKVISETYGNMADASVANAKVSEIEKTVERIDHDIQQIDEYINVLKEQGANVKEQTKWIAPQARANIYNLSEQAKLYAGTDQRASQSIFWEIENMVEDLSVKRSVADLNRSQTSINNIVRDIQKVTLDIEQKFGKANAWINLVGKGFQYVAGAAGAAAGAFYGTNKIGSFLKGSSSAPSIQLDSKGWLP